MPVAGGAAGRANAGLCPVSSFQFWFVATGYLLVNKASHYFTGQLRTRAPARRRLSLMALLSCVFRSQPITCRCLAAADVTANNRRRALIGQSVAVVVDQVAEERQYVTDKVNSSRLATRSSAIAE